MKKKTDSTKSSGTYALVIYLTRSTTIRVGKLGMVKFPHGYYLYIGSAMNSLNARIARHLANQQLARRAKITKDNVAIQDWRERKKKMHWHIDYLLEHAQVNEVWTHRGTERFECVWAQAAFGLPKAKVVAPRFGASDCNCATHLIFVGTRTPEEWVD